MLMSEDFSGAPESDEGSWNIKQAQKSAGVSLESGKSKILHGLFVRKGNTANSAPEAGWVRAACEH